MKRILLAGAVFMAAGLIGGAAQAQSTVKIGVILPYSGQFADGAKQVDEGIKLYMKQHGDSVGGKKIEIIRKDVGGIAPPVAKRLAEELVVRDKVDILAGWLLTPNAIAGCGVSAEAKKVSVIMNAATSIIVDKSPYCTRSAFTLTMVTTTLGQWAAKNGVKKAYTMVSDYAPGHDSEQGFINGFKSAGGEIVGSVRMAVANPDFSAYVQR
ncbi:MAG: ABC transporter substrate-binding protein, partial [Bryobacteraceae bacterium]